MTAVVAAPIPTLTFRPSFAVSFTAPVAVLNSARTPVWLVLALMAAVICAPRSALVAATAMPPISTPLMDTWPEAIAVAKPAEVTVAPTTTVFCTVAVTPLWPLTALIAPAIAMPLVFEASSPKDTPSALAAPTTKPFMVRPPATYAVEPTEAPSKTVV